MLNLPDSLFRLSNTNAFRLPVSVNVYSMTQSVVLFYDVCVCIIDIIKAGLCLGVCVCVNDIIKARLCSRGRVCLCVCVCVLPVTAINHQKIKIAWNFCTSCRMVEIPVPNVIKFEPRGFCPMER